MVRWIGFVVVAIAVGACSPATTSTGSAPTTTAAVPTTTTSSPTVTATTSAIESPDDVCLIGNLPFVDNGFVAAVGEDVGDATQIEQIRLDSASSCERLTISFTNGSGAPATSIGPTGISVLGFAGIVRIVAPPQMDTTAITDSLLEGELVDSATVLRDETGALVVDVRGTDGVPIVARAFATTSPASLVIDVATDSELPEIAGVTAAPTAIVISPVPGPNLYPLTVEGYAAPGLRSVRVQLGTDDSTDVDLSIALMGHIDAWQAFSSSIADGPSGQANVFVGTVDGNDQPVEGAIVPVDLP